MKRSIKFLSLTALLIALISGNVFAKESKEAEKNYLFTQTARWAELHKTDKADTYVLTLHNVSPIVTYFTDRPNRVSGAISTERFLKTWNQTSKDSFKKDAPNAGISGIRVLGLIDNQVKNNIILTLSNPIYDAKKHELSYQATSLSGEHVAFKNNKMFFRHVVLFFDDMGNICWSC